MDILSLFIVLVLFGIVFWGARTLMDAFSFPPPAKAVVIVGLVLFFVLGVIQALGGGNLPLPRLRL